MAKNRKSFSLHLLLFVVVEILFVVVIFHEFPETNVFTAIGVGHLAYWIIVLLAGIYRESVKHVWQRFLATYIPIVYHVALHLWIWVETLQAEEVYIDEHAGEHTWIVIWTIVAWLLILWWEWLLHRKFHCDTHHILAHAHCEEEGHDDCEDKHL